MNLLKKIIAALKKGEVIIYPTESCYSLGCLAKDKAAVEKIHLIKNEEPKPLTVLVNDLAQLKGIIRLNKTAEILARKFMPGQINLIAEKINPDILPHLGYTICFRIPNNLIARELCKKAGPITTTSANLHGMPSIYAIDEVIRTFSNKVRFIINAGDLNPKIAVSTIYDTITKKLVRTGPITLKQIEETLLE